MGGIENSQPLDVPVFNGDYLLCSEQQLSGASKIPISTIDSSYVVVNRFNPLCSTPCVFIRGGNHKVACRAGTGVLVSVAATLDCAIKQVVRDYAEDRYKTAGALGTTWIIKKGNHHQRIPFSHSCSCT